jgi:L-malate glycosyltransferase
LNICHIISGDLWGGAEAQVFQLVIDLKKMSDVNISVIVFNEGVLSDKLFLIDVNVTIIDESCHSLLGMIKNIMFELKKQQIGIVHFHGYKENFLGGIAARFLRINRIVRTHHGRGMIDTKSKNRFVEKINSVFFTDKIITVSSELQEFLKSFVLKRQEKKISVVRNGIDTTAINVHKTRVSLRKELGISEEDIIVGSTGRFVREKGHEYLLYAIEKVVKKGYKVRLILLGDGYLLKEYKSIINKLGISDYIIFPGFVDNVIDYVNIFDIFIMTSLNEGIPLALLEAMGLGKPVISTAVGGVPEVITDQVNGILIPVADSNACAEACCELIEHDQYRNKLAKKAKEHINNAFLAMHSAKNTKHVYDSL